MEFRLNEYHRNISDEELIFDLVSVANKLGAKSLTTEQYNKNGKYNSSTFIRRFEYWNKALNLAGLLPSHKNNFNQNNYNNDYNSNNYNNYNNIQNSFNNEYNNYNYNNEYNNNYGYNSEYNYNNQNVVQKHKGKKQEDEIRELTDEEFWNVYRYNPEQNQNNNTNNNSNNYW